MVRNNRQVVTKKKKLILGLGNDILTDDGIGLQILSDLKERFRDNDIVFETHSCGGLEIMEYIKGYERIIFIDGIHTANGRPGDVYHFTPSDFAETSHLSNLHDINFLTALKLGKILELEIPDALHIIAVEIVDDMTFNKGFTPAIADKYQDILQKVYKLVEQYLK